MPATKRSALVASLCGLCTPGAHPVTSEPAMAAGAGEGTVWTLCVPAAPETQPPRHGLDVEEEAIEGEAGPEARWSRTGNVGFGLAQVGSNSPSQTLRQATVPRAPSTLRRGQREIRWSETLANTWNQDSDEYRIDFGTLNSRVGLSYGITDQVLLDVAFSDVTRMDSVLDVISDGFHDVFGIEGGNRDDFPTADNRFKLLLDDGSIIQDDDSGSMTRDLSLTIQHTPTLGGDVLPALSYWGTVIYDSGGKNRVSGDRWSWAVGGAASKRVAPNWVLYASASHAWFGPDEYRNVAPGAFDLEDTQFQAAFGVEWQRGASSWIAEYLQTERWATRVDPFSVPAHELVLAWRRELGNGGLFELGLLENVIEYDNSADFGLHFAFLHRF